MRWFCFLVDERYAAVVDYAALRGAWEWYRKNPFEAVRILAAADKGALLLSPEDARHLVREHPHGFWISSIREHDLQIPLGEIYPIWIHVVLSGYEAGEEAEEKMLLLPESEAPGFNSERSLFVINDWILSSED
jgi:hypothetical protein